MNVINHLGVSGGKDSTALLLWAVYESGYDLDHLNVTFCDTGNEAPETYEYIQMLSEKVFPIHTLTPEKTFYDLCLHKRIFPSARRRFCTQFLKLLPTRLYIQSHLDVRQQVVMHSGVRRAESAERALLPEREVDDYFGLWTYRPLLDWSLDDVWDYLKRHGVKPNPLYALGVKRVGCFPCIMCSKHELRMIALHRPERVAYLVEQEREVNAALGNPSTYRSFFHCGKVPRSQRTLRCTNSRGQQIWVATIEDVFRWSRTSRGGQQYEMDLLEEPPTCNSRHGMCE